ncbi:Integrase catalytic domain-containing protein [Vibrio agarivorans]
MKFTFSIRSWGADAFEMSWLKKAITLIVNVSFVSYETWVSGLFTPSLERPTLANKAHKVYPYLLRDIEVTYPNQAWSIDITYIPMAKGFLYLVAIIDWYSRKVLSWRLSNTMDTSFCIEALEEALKHYGPPDIFNSDQGSQFTSTEFTQKLIEHGVRISMDGKGRWVDNVFIERLWRSLKYEEVYLKAYTTPREAELEIGHYMVFYNEERNHQGLNDLTPDEAYFGRQRYAA